METSAALQDLFRYTLSAALSCLVLFVGLRHLDPNRALEKKAAKRKKEIAKRLGRPLVHTNVYEVGFLSLSFGFSLSCSFFAVGVIVLCALTFITQAPVGIHCTTHTCVYTPKYPKSILLGGM